MGDFYEVWGAGRCRKSDVGPQLTAHQARASLNVGVVFAYQAVGRRARAAGSAVRCAWARSVTTEKSPMRAGGVREIARGDHGAGFRRPGGPAPRGRGPRVA